MMHGGYMSPRNRPWFNLLKKNHAAAISNKLARKEGDSKIARKY